MADIKESLLKESAAANDPAGRNSMGLADKIAPNLKVENLDEEQQVNE